MWTNFFITSAEAAATLAGLVIVAVSVNITRILAHPQLPARAGAAVSTLILILLSSMATLIPQSIRILGAELIFFGVCCWIIEVFSAQKSIVARRVSHRPIHESLIHVFFGQLQTLPFIIGGALMVLNNSAGIYGIAFGVMVVFFASMSNAWVLLVEILR
jgi:modulator of FtsH protease